MPTSLLTQAAIMATAGVAAAINSIAGGGTFLSFPALTGLAHLSEKAANMTSTVGLWPGSAASIAAARSEFKSIPKSMLWTFSVISLLGGAGGAMLLTFTDPHTFSLVVPWLLAFATIIFACSKPIARWAGRGHGNKSLKWTLFVAAIQLLVALYGGYFGAGIGVLMLAGLSFAGLDHIHQMNALKVLLATLINGVAVVVFTVNSFHGTTDSVDWPLAGGMVVTATIGGFAGMLIARKIRQDRLRILILLIGISLTLVYFYRAYRPQS